MWTQTEDDVFEYLRNAILSKPILQRANPDKRFYLKTDFSSIGMGFALCQPGDDEKCTTKTLAKNANLTYVLQNLEYTQYASVAANVSAMKCIFIHMLEKPLPQHGP